MATDTDEQKAVTEGLYKQNLELAVKNKTLSLLRQLYQISILALEENPLAFKIVETVRQAHEFELVGILIRKEDGSLAPLKFSLSDRLRAIETKTGSTLEESVIPDAANIPFFKEVFKNDPNHSEHIEDVWKGIVPAKALSAIVESAHIKTVSAYPLMIDGTLMGVLLICLNRPYDNLNQYERESIASLVDVTAVALDRARLYQELKIANEQQVVLIHFITHQVKGFFTKSKYIFDALLEGDYGDISDDIRQAATEGLNSDTNGVNMVQDILNASNIRKGTVQYSMQKLDIEPLIEEVVKDLGPSALAKKVDLTITPGKGPFVVNGDKTQLEHAIKNLIDNSIKYTPAGKIAVSIENKGAKILLSIKDTGVGVTPDDMKRLFTEGGHGKDSQKINVQSTGFGLFIVKNIIVAHGGTIWAESEGQGKGSQFYIELPIATA